MVETGRVVNSGHNLGSISSLWTQHWSIWHRAGYQVEACTEMRSSSGGAGTSPPEQTRDGSLCPQHLVIPIAWRDLCPATYYKCLWLEAIGICNLVLVTSIWWVCTTCLWKDARMEASQSTSRRSGIQRTTSQLPDLSPGLGAFQATCTPQCRILREVWKLSPLFGSLKPSAHSSVSQNTHEFGWRLLLIDQNLWVWGSRLDQPRRFQASNHDTEYD